MICNDYKYFAQMYSPEIGSDGIIGARQGVPAG